MACADKQSDKQISNKLISCQSIGSKPKYNKQNVQATDHQPGG